MNGLLILFILAALGSGSQEPTPEVFVPVEVRTTSAEQLQLARTLVAQIDSSANESAKQRAIVTALAHLEAVGMRWPDDKRAIMEARSVQYDLSMRYGMPQNAVEFMERVAAVATGEAEKASIQRRRAKALALLGRDAEAEAAFSEAETRQHQATPFERQAFLHERADYASSRRRHGEASKYLRKLAKLPDISSAVRMSTILKSLEENVTGGDRPAAKADYRELMRLYDAEKTKAPTDESEEEIRKIIAEALERHRVD
jgi:tetratricopeptide (TPR) repeat protein